jgi:Tol biopolymer transport system component
MLSPDGKWLLFLSSRPFPDGTPAFQPVPPYSDPAADIWLMPLTGGPAIPLGGPFKPYERVITDKFYGRVSFSPDGKKILFVADEGRDPRPEAEKQNDVIVVHQDQGEGYEGYRPMQIWIADLEENPKSTAALKIIKLTPGDFWYGDPQWSPDGSYIVCHANRNPEQESARYSINHNYDLWKISLTKRRLEQLTHGPARNSHHASRRTANGSYASAHRDSKARISMSLTSWSWTSIPRRRPRGSCLITTEKMPANHRTSHQRLRSRTTAGSTAAASGSTPRTA